MLWFVNDTFQRFVSSSVEWAFANTAWTAALLLAGAVLILALSYMISQKVYATREF